MTIGDRIPATRRRPGEKPSAERPAPGRAQPAPKHTEGQASTSAGDQRPPPTVGDQRLATRQR
jgi:hypothetical protein